MRPTVEEVQSFVNAMSKFEGNDESEDELKPEELIKKTFLEGNSVDVTKGDKIKVVKGDLNGLSGTVVSIDNGEVTFKPHMENFDENLKLDVTNVVKYFEPGDDVRVIEGKYKGETGTVTALEGKFAMIAID